MNSKAQTNVMVIILITIILAMVSISVVWSLVRSQQDRTAISGDIFTVANGTCIRVTSNCIVAGSTTSILNNSDGESLSNYTECGSASLLYGYDLVAGADSFLVGTVANASYTEEACGRITGMAGTIINYIPLLMAVVILVFVSMYAIK